MFTYLIPLRSASSSFRASTVISLLTEIFRNYYPLETVLDVLQYDQTSFSLLEELHTVTL